MPDELVLTFDFEEPLSAADLGEVFAALGRDYRDMTNGRILVVTSVERGSIIATLTDHVLAAQPYLVAGVAVIAGINQIAKFAENVLKWIEYAKSKTERKRLTRKGGKKAPGQRSVEAIVKVAAKTRSRVHVKHVTAKGASLEAELMPVEAIAVIEEQTTVETDAAPRMPGAHVVDTLDFRAVADRLQQAGGASHSPHEVQTVVDIFVGMLEAAGGTHFLPQLVSELEMRNLHTYADAVRQHIRPSPGTQLTTT
jgi:hypothetical protein